MKPKSSRPFLNSLQLGSFNVALTFASKPLLLAVAYSLGAATLTPIATAVSLTCDANTTAPANDGMGAWNTTTANWYDGTNDVLWANTTADTAIFGVGGTGGAVTVGTVNVGLIQFNPTVTTGYTLSGGTITLGTGITNTNTVNSTISSVITGTAALNATGLAFNGLLNSQVSVTLSGANTYTGLTTISTGGRLLSNATGLGSTAGANATTLGGNHTVVNTNASVGLTGSTAEAFLINGQGSIASGNGRGALQFAATMTLSSLVQLGSNAQITSNGSGASTISGNLDLQGFTLGVGNGTYAFGSTVPLTVSGVVQGTSAAILDVGAGGGSNIINLTGLSNTFSGTTRVNSSSGTSFVGLGNDNALGNSTLVFNGGGVQSNSATARTISNTIGTFTGNANFGPTSGTNVGTLTFTSTANTSLGSTTKTLTTNVDTTIAATLTTPADSPRQARPSCS